jgi:hypothetical protein
MASVKISQLTAAASVSGTQEFEINDSGTSKKVTGSQIKTFVKDAFAPSDIVGVTASVAEINKLTGTPAGLTATELGYVDGVTSAIQTQIDSKAPLTGTGASGTWPISISGDAASTDGKSFGTFTAAGGIAYATSTTALAANAAGTAGQVLLSGGAGAPTWGSVIDYQLFTATGTWTKPAGISANAIVFVEVWAAGGGGGMTGSNTDNTAGGGGGGSYGSLYKLASTLGATVSVTIGSGGTGATGAGGTGGAGGNSSFGSIITTYGGEGGTAGTATSRGGDGGGLEGAGGTWAGLGGIDASTNTGSTRGIFWGGGGGGAANGAANHSDFGGGGGGGGLRRGSGGATVVNAGGTSRFGGNGGTGTYTPNNTAGGAGNAPSGGGGGGVNATGGAGARGEVRVWTIG